jgi:hypothetical protein
MAMNAWVVMCVLVRRVFTKGMESEINCNSVCVWSPNVPYGPYDLLHGRMILSYGIEYHVLKKYYL